MMTPEEHYREAERYLSAADTITRNIDWVNDDVDRQMGIANQAIAEAQVHATLANATAIVIYE